MPHPPLTAVEHQQMQEHIPTLQKVIRLLNHPAQGRNVALMLQHLASFPRGAALINAAHEANKLEDARAAFHRPPTQAQGLLPLSPPVQKKPVGLPLSNPKPSSPAIRRYPGNRSAT